MDSGTKHLTSLEPDPYEGDCEKSLSSSPDSTISLPLHHVGSKLKAMQPTDGLQSRGSSSSLSGRPVSPSAFAPGPHRRSHPNLQHLSLAPLAPKYPITPSDYDAYFDPDTSQLHTSTSLSQLATVPAPGGILTSSPARSRATSRTRGLKRKTRSTIVFKTQEMDRHRLGKIESNLMPQGGVSSQVMGGNVTDSSSLPKPRSKSNLKLQASKPATDPGWLVQTGLTLTEGSRESKGQSWLVKRASSTSLHTPIPDIYTDENQANGPARSPYASGMTTPARSRRSSRDRRRSRRELTMTPATAPSSTANLAGSDDPSQSTFIAPASHDKGCSGPDWADSQTQAEIAAELEREMANELEADSQVSGEREWWREDRYGTVDFEGQFDDEEGEDDDVDEDEDEAEVRKALRQRGGFGVGKWVDGLVDVFLKLDHEDYEDDAERDLETGTVFKDDRVVPPPGTVGEGASKTTAEPFNEGEDDDDSSMEPAPSNPQSVWEDVAWFGRLILRTARS